MPKAERFLCRTRQIFAGILGVLQGNLTKFGAKIAGFGRSDDFRIHPNPVFTAELKNMLI